MSDSPFKITDGSDAKPGRVVYTVDALTGIISGRTVDACVMVADTPHVLSGGLTYHCQLCYPTRFAAREHSRRDAEFGLRYHAERLELCRRAIRELDTPDDLPAALPAAETPTEAADEIPGWPTDKHGPVYNEHGQPIS